MHDPTTGLPNRRRLEDDLNEHLMEKALGVIFVDLDGFKAINDQLGHAHGDEILRAVASRLQSTVREGDLVARYGGDEFVVVCDVTDGDTVGEIAERIRLALRAPYPGLPTTLVLAASIGVATGPMVQRAASVDRLIRSADQAMYRAKLAGGDQVASS